MTEKFNWSEFGSAEGEHDPDFHFASTYSPILKYDHILKSNDSIGEGLSRFDGRKERNARAYACVAIFRDTMEYIEEFGIYIYSLLNADESFIDNITRTAPGEIKKVFTYLRDGDLNDLIGENIEFETFDALLKRYFGYEMFLQERFELSDIHNEKDLIIDSKEEAVEVSIESIKNKLQRISWFFLYFDDAYNAIKHGNRVSIRQPSTVEITNEHNGEKYEVDISEPVAEFLCKASGDRSQGKRYTFSAPADHLRKNSVRIAEECKSIYKPLYEVSHALRESAHIASKEEISIDTAFYGIRESEGKKDSYNYTNIKNPDTSMWIPEQIVPEEFSEPEPEFYNTAFAAFREQNGELVVETVGEDDPSYDYPIKIEGKASPDNDQMIGWNGEINFNFRVSQLPLWQYKELLDLKDNSPFTSLILKNSDEDISKKVRLDNEITTPQIERPEYWSLLQFACRVGLASDINLFYPVYLYEEAGQILEKYKSQNLTREVANNCLQDLAVATSDCIYTEVVAAVLDPEKRTGEGYKINQSSAINSTPGAYNFEFEEGSLQDIRIDDGYSEDFERQDPGQLDTIILMLVTESADEIYERLLEDGLISLNSFEEVIDPKEAVSCITINREHGIATHWYWFDRLNINIYSGIPPHAEENISQLYPK